MTALPVGVVTFLFTDIEGSTRLAHELGEDWPGVLQAHHRVIREVFPAFNGVEVSTAGDSFFVAFPDAADAIAATIALQRAIANHDWRPHAPIKVRMGLHTGEATMHDNDYAGLTVHAASRVESAAAGGQVLITEATLSAATNLPDGVDTLDLGLHRLKDLPAEVHIFQIVADGLGRDFPPVRGLDVLRNNVPVPPSSFIGRSETLTKLHRLLDEDRLVTLVGPGGAGKTRISLKLASERLHRYADGVWFVELDPTHDEGSVAAAVADALGVREQPGRPVLDDLVDHVRDRSVLLVLDNCEHVIDAAAKVVEDVLRAGQGVRALASSREPLQIGGERLWPVAPLSLDPPEDSEAVQLLADRIGRVQPDFELSPAIIESLVSVARRLDGLPLALELAAASAALLSVDEIAHQLDDRFQLLTRGSRTALDRQKTLWGAIDWSYSLLTDDLRARFRQLGVFPGEFDYEAAAGVAGEDLDAAARGIDQLVWKSLVTQTPSGRFRMLESIRAYARERLFESGEAEATAERHARWFASALLVPESGPAWARDPDGPGGVHDDLVASLEWATDHDTKTAVQLLDPLQRFWVRRARWAEGRMLTERTLVATTDVQDASRRDALSRSGDLALMMGDFAAARVCFEDAATLTGLLDGEQAELVNRANLGVVAMHQGDLDTAEQLLQRGVEFAPTDASASVRAILQTQLAEVSRLRGDVDEAWRRGNEALDAARAAGDDNLVIHVVNLLGGVAQQRGDLDTARQFYGDALDSARAAGDNGPIIYLLFCLAILALDDGKPEDAAPLLAEAITLGRDADAKADLAESLEATARLAVEYGEHAVACRLVAAVDALRADIGFARPPSETAAYDAAVSRLRESCGASFDELWTAGGALSLDDAITAALAVLGV